MGQVKDTLGEMGADDDGLAGAGGELWMRTVVEYVRVCDCGQKDWCAARHACCINMHSFVWLVNAVLSVTEPLVILCFFSTSSIYWYVVTVLK